MNKYEIGFSLRPCAAALNNLGTFHLLYNKAETELVEVVAVASIASAFDRLRRRLVSGFKRMKYIQQLSEELP